MDALGEGVAINTLAIFQEVADFTYIALGWPTNVTFSALIGQTSSIDALIFADVKPVILGTLLAHFWIGNAFITLLDLAGQI